MTRSGYLRAIGNTTGLMNSAALRMQDLPSRDPRYFQLSAEWSTFNHRRQDLVGAALAAGIDRETIQAITYRETPMRLR